MFQKILLPTDGSRHSAEAARVAAELAARHGGTVHPVVAVEYQYITGEEVPEAVSAHIRERIDARANQALEQANEAVRQGGGKTDGGRIIEGPSPEAILSEADEGEYDVIVMGSRGVSLDDGRERLLGSVAERVLHRASCPVLVIPADLRP